ncbi:hypothetical protein OF83DRAFT_773765 [Amylostereum chailletii]|nr:hypothetical protein OF83DRAFT_773765 [Amylostereum chailletii]
MAHRAAGGSNLPVIVNNSVRTRRTRPTRPHPAHGCSSRIIKIGRCRKHGGSSRCISPKKAIYHRISGLRFPSAWRSDPCMFHCQEHMGLNAV